MQDKKWSDSKYIEKRITGLAIGATILEIQIALIVLQMAGII